MARTRQTAAREDSEAQAPAAGERGKISKTQIVEQVVGRTSLNRKQASAAVACMVETVVDALRSGRSVGLPGLGTLSVTQTAGRQGVRPGTNERIQIPPGKKIRFKAATTLRGNL